MANKNLLVPEHERDDSEQSDPSEQVVGEIRRRAASEPIRSVAPGTQGPRRLRGGGHGGTKERMHVRDANSQWVRRANGGELNQDMRA